MKLYSFIASRLSLPTATGRLSKRVALISIWASVTIMVLALGIASGFRGAISEKIVAFLGAVEITDTNPWSVEHTNTERLDSGSLGDFNEIIAPQHLKEVVQAGVVIQNGFSNIGVVIKGIEGSDLAADEIQISKTAADELGLKTGDNVDVVVFGEYPLRRSMRLVEPFSSDMQDMERTLAFVAPFTAREISGIDSSQVSYYLIDRSTDMAPVVEFCDQEGMTALTARDRMPQVFDWLEMIDQNMLLVLIIMVVVAIISVVCATLIVILESTRTIATLRAMGMRSGGVQRVFLITMSRIITVGVLGGVASGVVLGFLQAQFGVITLDSASYFLTTIPVDLDPVKLGVLTVGSIVVIGVAVMLPIAIIAKMKIVDSLKYE